MIKGIIFDLGGTLLHFKGDLPRCEQQGALAVGEWFLKKQRIRLNVPALAEAVLAARQTGLQHAAESLVEFKMSDGIAAALQAIDAPARALPLAEQAARYFFIEEEAGHTLIPQTIETLKILQKTGLKPGLLSNATDDGLIQRLVNRTGLRPYLSPVFSSAGLGRQKPHPAPFRLIAERWQLPPEQIAVVGDTLKTDILGAQKAGMRGILLTVFEHHSNAQNRHIQPQATIATLSELPDAISNL